MPCVRIKRAFYDKIVKANETISTEQGFVLLHSKLGSGTIVFDYQVIDAIHKGIRDNRVIHGTDRVIVRYNLDPQQQGV